MFVKDVAVSIVNTSSCRRSLTIRVHCLGALKLLQDSGDPSHSTPPINKIVLYDERLFDVQRSMAIIH